MGGAFGQGKIHTCRGSGGMLLRKNFRNFGLPRTKLHFAGFHGGEIEKDNVE